MVTAVTLRLFPLRIAMVVPPWYELPPDGYGGVEAMCAALVDTLAERGHDVTVFGAGRRRGTAGSFVSTTAQPQHARLGEMMPAVLHAARVDALLRDGDFDVIHDHSMCGPLTAAYRPAPTVVTVHGPVRGEIGDFFDALGGSVHLVAVSRSQRDERPALPWIGTVHNAVDPARFEPTVRTAGPVLWLARMCPEKGPDLAIHACRAAGLPLVLAGKCTEPAERRYLDTVVRPLLGDDVDLVLNADRPTIEGLLQDARCLIMPIRWEEPFGMAMIEAMAAGRPVVALRRGSVPEIIRDGVTGWICDHPDELPDALRRVDELDPARCVAHVAALFGSGLMADRYETIYRTAMAYPDQPAGHGPNGQVRRLAAGTVIREGH
jgi:glycosyltransferase involved in cell wall biosynthesis